MNSMDLAKQYEVDMGKITRFLFQEVDSQGYKVESYLSHVRIIEDSKSPSSRPPANSPQANKKDRFLLLSVKASGRMRLHKAKESSSGVIQIGRSWDFDELTSLELDDQVPTGFICQMGKKYYWEVHTPKERRVWCTTLIDKFIKYTQGKTPNLVNCSVSYFHLEDLYDSFQSGNSRSSNNVNMGANINRLSAPSQKALTPVQTAPKSFTSPLRSPSKSNSQDMTSLKRDLATPVPLDSPTYGSQSQGARAATAAALAGVGFKGAANAQKLANPDLENRAKLENERKRWELEKRKQEEEKARRLELEKQQELEMKRQQEAEKRRQSEIEKRRQSEIEKRRQAEIEKRKQQELERRRQEQEELQMQLQLQQQQKEKEELEASAAVAKQKEMARLKLQREENFANTQFKQPSISHIAKRGPPSAALSNAPSQMSFEYGDDARYQAMNGSFESAISDGLDNYIDDYVSNGEEETAPLNLSLPKPRARANNGVDVEKKNVERPTFQVPTITTTLDDESGNNSLDNKHNNIPLEETEKEVNKLLTSVNHLQTLESNMDNVSPHKDTRNRGRSRAFSRVTDSKPDNYDLLELLEEIGYDPITDDSASLQIKLLNELDKLQYEKIQSLTQVTSVTSALKQSIATAFQSCDHIDPILSLFGVELSAFKDDVDFIEAQGQGLQVEATNEKLLMNELNEIVHSVEISDLKLQKLLTSKITLGYQNYELEKILNELYIALLKINDSKDIEENSDAMGGDYQISKMNALQEKKKIFEGAKNKFISNFKHTSQKMFESVSMSLSSKLEHVNSENFDSKFLKTIFLDKSAYLLTISGLIAFVKNVSIDDYDDILNSFVNAFKPFFENLTTVLIKKLSQSVVKFDSLQISFDSNPKDLVTENYMSNRNRKDFGSKRSNGIFSEDSKKSEEENKNSVENDLISLISTYCSQLINVMCIEQELIKHLFGLSSSPDYLFQNLVKKSLEKRCEKFSTISNFTNTAIESDRSVSDEIYELMKQLFDLTFNSTLKILLATSKNNIVETPAILCLVKSFSNSLAPTSHEFLYSSFTKVGTKLSVIWSKEVDQQIQIINNTPIRCSVMNFTKAYPVFYRKVQRVIDSLNLVNIAAFGTDEKVYGNYYLMWGVIKNALNKGVQTLKIELPLSETSVDADDDGRDIDANVSIQKHLTLLINFKWLFEESKNLQEFPKDLSKAIDDMRDKELRDFTSSFARLYKIGNIIRLVEDLENLLDTNGNPANFSTYTVENIKGMMAPFKGDSFKQQISIIAASLSGMLKGRCYNVADEAIENKYSIAIGEQIEKELYNNCMNAMCQLFIATFTKLSAIVDKYYTNFEVPVDKYIINFNFKKHYTV